jgi:hypothetical protein
MSETVYSVIAGGFALLFGWLLVRGLKSGEMEFPYTGGTFSGRRQEQPVRFWLVAALLGLLSLGGALGMLGQIFFPRGLGL